MSAIILAAVLGALAGFGFSKVFFKPKAAQDFTKEIELLKEERNNLTMTCAVNDDRIMSLHKEVDIKREEHKSLTDALVIMKEQIAKESAMRQSAELRVKEQRAEFDAIKEQLKNDFKLLAASVLDTTTARFTEQNKTAIDALMQPVAEKFAELKAKIEATHDSATRDGVSLREQIKHLTDLNLQMSAEANNLTTALKGQNKTMGNWGEMILETILEGSGLRKGEEYVIQESFTTDAGRRLQPDVVVHLPDKKHLIVDSKVTLVAYERYCSCDGDERKGSYLIDHINSLYGHIDDLSGKRYQDLYQISAPDFVMLFVPIDPALIVALQHDPKLYVYAFERGVFLVSPSTLLFALRTIANLWRREKQDLNAMEIAKRGGQLYDKFVSFFICMQSMGTGIKKLSETYEDALNKLKTGRGSLIRQAEMMRELGARTSKALPEDVLAEADNDSQQQ